MDEDDYAGRLREYVAFTNRLVLDANAGRTAYAESRAPPTASRWRSCCWWWQMPSPRAA